MRTQRYLKVWRAGIPPQRVLRKKPRTKQNRRKLVLNIHEAIVNLILVSFELLFSVENHENLHENYWYL